MSEMRRAALITVFCVLGFFLTVIAIRVFQ
jgi:hypothetical protein